MAAWACAFSPAQAIEPVGFDHFALPGDPLAKAAEQGGCIAISRASPTTLTVLIGLGASAISSFPDLLVQNEKNAGRYRMLLSQDSAGRVGCAAARRAIRGSGALIEALLCQGEARRSASGYWRSRRRLRPSSRAVLPHTTANS